MKLDGNTTSISTTDLVGHLNSAHLTELDLAVANGRLAAPAFRDPFRELLQERGSRHGQKYIDHLKAKGLAVHVIGGVGADDEKTVPRRRIGRR
jgi:hypothetical protein